MLIADVNDLKSNTSHFLCVEMKMIVSKEANKIFLYLVVNYEVGALFKVSQVFAKHQVNMQKLKSRPLKG